MGASIGGLCWINADGPETLRAFRYEDGEYPWVGSVGGNADGPETLRAFRYEGGDGRRNAARVWLQRRGVMDVAAGWLLSISTNSVTIVYRRRAVLPTVAI